MRRRASTGPALTTPRTYLTVHVVRAAEAAPMDLETIARLYVRGRLRMAGRDPDTGLLLTPTVRPLAEDVPDAA